MDFISYSCTAYQFWTLMLVKHPNPINSTSLMQLCHWSACCILMGTSVLKGRGICVLCSRVLCLCWRFYSNLHQLSCWCKSSGTQKGGSRPGRGTGYWWCHCHCLLLALDTHPSLPQSWHHSFPSPHADLPCLGLFLGLLVYGCLLLVAIAWLRLLRPL